MYDPGNTFFDGDRNRWFDEPGEGSAAQSAVDCMHTHSPGATLGICLTDTECTR